MLNDEQLPHKHYLFCFFCMWHEVKQCQRLLHSAISQALKLATLSSLLTSLMFLQVAFSNVIAVGWNTYLSWASHHSPSSSSPLEPV